MAGVYDAIQVFVLEHRGCRCWLRGGSADDLSDTTSAEECSALA